MSMHIINVTCTYGFILQSDWYRQTQALEVDNFSLLNHVVYTNGTNSHDYGNLHFNLVHMNVYSIATLNPKQVGVDNAKLKG